MYKKIILFLSIILLLIGNIGLTIFSHTCKKEGVFISLYFKGEHDCKLEAAEETPPCCREVTTKKDCCKGEFARISAVAVPKSNKVPASTGECNNVLFDMRIL